LALHACGVKRIFLVDLDDLLGLTVLGFGFHLLLKLSSGVILELLHVSIEDHPLGGFYGESASNRRVSFVTTLTQGQVECLGGALLIEELVTQ